MAEKRFVEVYSQGMTSIYKIIVDTHTGVNYLIAFNAACGSGMTVLLDAEGTPLVSPPREARIRRSPGQAVPGSAHFWAIECFFCIYFPILYAEKGALSAHIYPAYMHKRAF